MLLRKSKGELLNPHLHLPFFEALADTEKPSAAWNEVTAGLVVLRMLDDWMDPRMQDLPRTKEPLGIRAAVEAIESESPLRAPLLAAFEAMMHAQRVDIRGPAPHLLAYAQALETVGRRRLAVEVYETLLRHMREANDSEGGSGVFAMLAACRREM